MSMITTLLLFMTQPVRLTCHTRLKSSDPPKFTINNPPMGEPTYNIQQPARYHYFISLGLLILTLGSLNGA